jgi:hypothetical protein
MARKITETDIAGLTKGKAALVRDALQAGHTVTTDAGVIWFIRWSKHAKPRMLEGSMVLHPCGTAFSLNVHISVAGGLRSHAAMRRCLGLA